MAAQNGRKCTFGQFKDHNLGMKHDKWPHFYLLFLLELFVIFVFIFENGQNSFSCGLSFGLSWSLKYLNFEQKLSIQTAYHIFLESTQPEVTKIHIMFLSSKGSQKKKDISWWAEVHISIISTSISPTLCCPLFLKIISTIRSASTK